jgi:hypothetical protein
MTCPLVGKHLKLHIGESVFTQGLSMSKGPGRVELAIEQAFAEEPDNAFSVEDLCKWVYPGCRTIEKKHRVAILRAIKGRPNTERWHNDMKIGVHKFGTVFFYTPDNVKSYATARLKADMNEWETEAMIHAKLQKGGNERKYILPGGAWHRHTEIFKAKRDGNVERLEELQAEQDRIIASL